MTGNTPIEYRNNIRIEHAKALLQEGLLVSEVGGQLGFSSPAYFCDAFKKRVGCSPSEFLSTLPKTKEQRKSSLFS